MQTSPPLVSFIVPLTERPYMPFDSRLGALLTTLCSLSYSEVILHVTGDLSEAHWQVIRQFEPALIVQQQTSGVSKTYSPGQARNHAVTAAKGDYVFFIDVDLVVCPELLAQLQARAQHLSAIGAFSFEMYPCLYLSEQQVGSFKGDFNACLASYMQGDNALVDGIALGSSCLLVNRLWFLKLGGFDVEFIGHGGEDFALIHKLCLHYPIGTMPTDHADNIKAQHPGDYLGCRRYYSLYALAHLFEGRFLVHLWHPRPLTHTYHKRRAINDKLLSDKLSHFELIEPTVTAELTAQQQLACKVVDVVDDLNTNFKPWLGRLQAEKGYPVEDYPGLFKWAENVVVKRTFRRKLRKLYLNPKLFIKDMLNKI